MVLAQLVEPRRTYLDVGDHTAVWRECQHCHTMFTGTDCDDHCPECCEHPYV
jgi:rubrerythrin